MEQEVGDDLEILRMVHMPLGAENSDRLLDMRSSACASKELQFGSSGKKWSCSGGGRIAGPVLKCAFDEPLGFSPQIIAITLLYLKQNYVAFLFVEHFASIEKPIVLRTHVQHIILWESHVPPLIAC